MKAYSVALVFLLCASLQGVQINFYSNLGQLVDQVTVENDTFETYFAANDYNDIVQGSINFPGATLTELNLYSSNEYLRNTQVHVRTQAECSFSKAKLIDPYSFLVEAGSKFFYANQDNIQFNKAPQINGKILSARFKNTKGKKSSFTYLTRGLSWTPRYDVTILNESSATLRALADIVNNHQRLYQVNNSTLTSGTVYLVSSYPSAPVYMGSFKSAMAASISDVPTASNYGTYTYQINEAYTLYPQSVKSLPFINPTIVFAYTLEIATYIPSGGSTSGLFQRMFNIRPSEFLPAGPVTFYQNQMILGQSSIPDTAKNASTTVALGTDPDIQYTIDSIVTSYSQSPYAQDLSVNVTLFNRKDKQTVAVKLILSGGYLTTTFKIKSTSSSLTITQDPLINSTVIIEATIKPGKKETGSFNVKQSN